MGREFIGESSAEEDPKLDSLEIELAIKYIKQECGQPPRGVDVQVTLEDHELGSYPVISVIWDDSVIEYPASTLGSALKPLSTLTCPRTFTSDTKNYLTFNTGLRSCSTSIQAFESSEARRNGRSRISRNQNEKRTARLSS
jgi:hypothetical protein